MTSKLTLIFDSDTRQENWIGWYLDGGGDRTLICHTTLTQVKVTIRQTLITKPVMK